MIDQFGGVLVAFWGRRVGRHGHTAPGRFLRVTGFPSENLGWLGHPLEHGNRHLMAICPSHFSTSQFGFMNCLITNYHWILTRLATQEPDFVWVSRRYDCLTEIRVDFLRLAESERTGAEENPTQRSSSSSTPAERQWKKMGPCRGQQGWHEKDMIRLSTWPVNSRIMEMKQSGCFTLQCTLKQIESVHLHRFGHCAALLALFFWLSFNSW